MCANAALYRMLQTWGLRVFVEFFGQVLVLGTELFGVLWGLPGLDATPGDVLRCRGTRPGGGPDEEHGGGLARWGVCGGGGLSQSKRGGVDRGPFLPFLDSPLPSGDPKSRRNMKRTPKAPQTFRWGGSIPPPPNCPATRIFK